jgi:phytoene dehydrogenase-like protein
MDYDVAVIGSGHNGLVCAAYLAREGYTVGVFERRNTIGGAVCTEEMFGGFRMDVGGSAHFMIHHTPIVSDLGLDRYGLEYIPMNPFMSAPFEDGTVIRFYQDLDQTCNSIAEVSERDAEAYRQFILRWRPLNRAVFDVFLQKPRLLAMGRTLFRRGLISRKAGTTDLVRTILQSYGRVLDDTFESDKLKAALAWWGAQSGPPPMDAVSAEFIGWHSVIHDRGPARPRGGSGMLTQALKKYIEDHGGQVFPDSEVSRILVNDGRASGIRLKKGDTVTARRVVSNAHLRHTFLSLLSDWTPPGLRHRIERVYVGNGFGMVLRCAMNELPRYTVPSPHNREILNGLQLLCPSTQYLADTYADFLKGRPSENPAAIGMTFSAIDPSLAPDGKHTLFVWGQYYPYHLRDNASWETIRRAEAEKLLSVVERFAPGTRETLIDMYIQSPDVIEKKHAMPNANVMHVEMLIDQMFTLRPLPELSGYETPVRGLFLANAGMHPGGGIFGAAGYNCSFVVRDSLRKRLFRR